MGFGSSSELDEYEADASLTVEQFRQKHGDAFLLIDAAYAEADDGGDESGFDDPTNPGIRLKSGTAPTWPYVFAVAKRTNTEFSFIALGRNVGNDIHVPHASVSRFHAYFRITPAGIVVQDAKSSTGLLLNDVPVPKGGAGDAVRVLPGATLRFGSLSAAFVDAAGLLAALQAGGSAGLG